VPITDAGACPTLVFVKGALAVHALRKEIGDEAFFKAFRSLFETEMKTEVTLDRYRACFEKVHGKSLKTFFDRWYYGKGVPDA
jgi:aminopeptidase N